MKSKILIAIGDDFTRNVYSEVFKAEKFEVLETKDGKEALNLVKNEKPDIILADVFLPEMGGFDLIETLRKTTETKRIPIMIFSQVEREEDKQRALELGVKDFIVGVLTSPPDVVLRTRMHLGEQKTYLMSIPKDSESAKELIHDLGHDSELVCSRCGSELRLSLIRDLTKGKNYFKVSFFCPKCD